MKRLAWIAAGLALLVCLNGTALAGWALAGWGSPGGGGGYSRAYALSGGSVPTASVSGRNVTVSWSASAGVVPVTGYEVKRYNELGQSQTVGAGCSAVVAGLSCTEQAVPAGQWSYTVTPRNNNWKGTESGKSAAVTIASPALSLTPITVPILPATLSGQITGFVGGQTVTFRLDNAVSGTVLAGSILPSPVPSGGTSSVSVTLPAGTSPGAHTVYAVGSAGDTAGAPVTVGTTTTIGVQAWDLRDASAGAAEVNASGATAFANDGRSSTSQNFATAFSTTRYVQAKFNSPLPAGAAASSVFLNLNFAGTVAGDTTCFYFDVRRVSTGAVVSTHGSSAAPVECTTTTTFKATSTALPAVTTSDIADDLQVRIYARSSGNRPLKIDLASIAGTISGQSFTLYESSMIDSATGTPGAAAPWTLFVADAVAHTTAGSWATSFAPSRFLRMSFPGYVPTAAVVDSATFVHTYLSSEKNAEVCNYFEVYSGASLLAAHGSAAAPISCNSSNTVWKTDSVPLPEVTTASAANALSVKLYVRRNKAGTSRHDLAEVQIKYTK